jgi:glycerol-3-phosphate acyltransferase PlsX
VNRKIVIALDGMGGDHAPREVVLGAAEAVRSLDVGIALTGREDLLQEELARVSPRPQGITIVPAADTVGMDEHAALAVRHKRDSSINAAMHLAKNGDAQAVVSAGNSGATMAAALLLLGRIEGVERPAIGGVLPTGADPVLLLDVGANADCKPSFLLQFARVGEVYMRLAHGVVQPRVALLSNGEEDAKGNQLVQEARVLLRSSGLNFIGNVEGRQILKGAADVVVTDGFTGNVALKVAEGMSEFIFEELKRTLINRFVARAAAGITLGPTLRALKHRLDYAERGGAPLLGVRGMVFIAHGRSDARAICNAVRVAKEAVELGVLAATEAALSARSLS